MNKPSLEVFGNSAVLLRWEQEISLELNERIRKTEAILLDMFAADILETSFTYAELIVYLNVSTRPIEFLENLRKINWEISAFQEFDHFLYQIPVCYTPDFGWDIALLAAEKKMTIQELIDWHTSATYPVYFIGFLPGFPYLGDLPEVLHFPRRSTPRTKVPTGAVGIGGRQTGIYPMESPGGWHVIGQTPVHLFDSQKDNSVFLKSGDHVQFVSVSPEEFEKIRMEIEAGIYKLEKIRLS